MKKKLTKREKNKQIVEALLKAFDWSEGRYSGIPDCCIKQFVNGMTHAKFVSKLSKKDKEKFYALGYKVQYVPCRDCFKSNKFIKIKYNGTSSQGEIIRALIKQFGDCFR